MSPARTSCRRRRGGGPRCASAGVPGSPSDFHSRYGVPSSSTNGCGSMDPLGSASQCMRPTGRVDERAGGLGRRRHRDAEAVAIEGDAGRVERDVAGADLGHAGRPHLLGQPPRHRAVDGPLGRERQGVGASRTLSRVDVRGRVPPTGGGSWRTSPAGTSRRWRCRRRSSGSRHARSTGQESCRCTRAPAGTTVHRDRRGPAARARGSAARISTTTATSALRTPNYRPPTRRVGRGVRRRGGPSAPPWAHGCATRR